MLGFTPNTSVREWTSFDGPWGRSFVRSRLVIGLHLRSRDIGLGPDWPGLTYLAQDIEHRESDLNGLISPFQAFERSVAIIRRWQRKIARLHHVSPFHFLLPLLYAKVSSGRPTDKGNPKS